MVVRQRDKTKAIRQGLMQQLFTGLVWTVALGGDGK